MISWAIFLLFVLIAYRLEEPKFSVLVFLLLWVPWNLYDLHRVGREMEAALGAEPLEPQQYLLALLLMTIWASIVYAATRLAKKQAMTGHAPTAY